MHEKDVIDCGVACCHFCGKCVRAGQRAPASVDAKAPAFDVVSIKPNKSGSGNTTINSREGSFSAVNVSVENMLINAYNVKEYLIPGVTGWAASISMPRS